MNPLMLTTCKTFEDFVERYNGEGDGYELVARKLFEEVQGLRDVAEVERLGKLETRCELQEAEADREAYRGTVKQQRKDMIELKTKIKTLEAQVRAGETKQLQADLLCKRTEDRIQVMFDELRVSSPASPVESPTSVQYVLPDHTTCGVQDVFAVVQNAMESIRQITIELEKATVTGVEQTQRECIFVMCLLSEVSSMLSYTEDMCLGICDEPTPTHPHPTLGPVYHKLTAAVRSQSIRTKTVIGRIRKKLKESNSTGPLAAPYPTTSAAPIRSSQSFSAPSFADETDEFTNIPL
eukprot:TRINITY_DN24763_c0_g1_i1.p1 TRINITY_DN24763_c0_g1~~TRINITY_DN24763_c0_g1_i1.p1  ORF type:complete len:295 (+),score=53.24 TRINITY_DN24763_c0_g1_i1:71-955(+)